MGGFFSPFFFIMSLLSKHPIISMCYFNNFFKKHFFDLMIYYGKSPNIKSEKALESDKLGFKSLSGLVPSDKLLSGSCCT